jgi:trimeric autotransporter adhesin
MQARNSGIAPLVITVAVIALVVVAAVAGYVLLSKGPTNSSAVQTSSSSSSTVSTTISIGSTGSISTSQGTSTQSSSTISSTSTASSSLGSSTTSSTTASTIQTSSTTAITTSSASTCSTNTTSPFASPLTDFATLLGNFSQLSMTLGSSSGSGISHSESSYSVAYASTSGGLTTYKVEINASGALSQAWITSSGTVIAFSSGGGNETGAQASTALSSSAAPFLSLIVQGQLLDLYTSSPQVQPVNQTGVMLGPTSLYVTNFAARSLPALASTCTDAYTFTSFSLQAVAISGTDIILVTQENIQGTDVAGSVTTPVYAVLQINSLTQA